MKQLHDFGNYLRKKYEKCKGLLTQVHDSEEFKLLDNKHKVDFIFIFKKIKQKSIFLHYTGVFELFELSQWS